MKISRVQQYFLMAIGLSIVISLFIYLTPLIESLTPRGRHASNRGQHIFLNMAITAGVSFCTFTLNYFFVKPLHTVTRTTTKEVILALIITLLSVTILSDVFYSLFHGGNRVRFFQFNFIHTIRDVTISMVVLGGVFLIKMVTDRQRIILENEQLTRENLQRRYESLKNQVSPHFLFNSLSALKSLIHESPNNAQQYIDHLSHVLRYSLSGHKTRTVSLGEELEVVNSYLFLIKMRYESNIIVETNIQSNYHYYHIPPLALQTLIENAIKHNVISKKYPLTIRIAVSQDRLVVTNTLREKYSDEEGTGIGLPNLSNQYRLLGYGDIQITRTEKEFKVELPLLKPSGHESSDRGG